MKKIVTLVLLLTATTYYNSNAQPYTTAIQNFEKSVTELTEELTKLTVNERREMLEQQHKLVYELPHTPEYIFENIFPEIIQHRSHLAPHFPARSASIETDKVNMNNWLQNYPHELAAYLQYVSKFITNYSKNNEK